MSEATVGMTEGVICQEFLGLNTHFFTYALVDLERNVVYIIHFVLSTSSRTQIHYCNWSIGLQIG